MAKFCTNCGKKLENGKKCDCEKEEMTKKETVENKGAINDFVNDYLNVLKGIFSKPIDTIKTYSKKSKFTLGLIMIAINSIIFGLFVYLLCKEGTSQIFSLMYGSVSSLISSSNIDVPISVLFISMLFMAVYHLCLGGLLHFTSKTIMKKDSDIKITYSFIGVNAVLTTVTTLVALICMYINTGFALILIAIAGILYLLNLYHGFIELTKIDKNKIAYVFTGSYVVTIFLVCYILPKIFS